MDKESIEVSDDNIFLQQLLDKHNICAKQLALWSGRAASTVYKYLSGELTIPTVVWRSIFERTLDISILKLFTGEISCIFAPLVKIAAKPDATTMSHLLKMRQKQIKCEKYILQILDDGKIDKSDVHAIANYKLAFPDMISTQAQIYQAITNEFEKVTK